MNFKYLQIPVMETRIISHHLQKAGEKSVFSLE